MPTPQVFRSLPFMGVIRVNNEAMKVGWKMGDPNWTNLGQGQPEIGLIPNCPPRFDSLKIDVADHGYGPVEGIPEYRQAVADHYNRLYRKNHSSKYTVDNVCIAPGGRAALTRIGAALDATRLGYFTPDYTAYEDLLTTFPRIEPHHIELKADQGFRIDPKALEDRVVSEKLNALLISNPCNPTGHVIQGPDLAAWVEMSRKHNTTLLMDEFYSHYIYPPLSSSSALSTQSSALGPVSSAAFINNVNEDPVLIIDGLTKCFRYPGWRSGWVLGPKDIIQKLTAAGSFLDGGPSRPIQRAAIEVLKPDRADQETSAVRAEFAIKQRLTIDALTMLGIEFPGNPQSTFYVFGSIAKLPAPLNDGLSFMHAAFKHRVLTVPGEFFDVNPERDGRRRTGKSPLASFVRFSFGPPRTNLEAGLSRLTDLLKSVR